MPLNLEQYREELTEHLVRTCTGNGFLKGILLNSPDIDNVWLRLMQPFCGDAVREFNNYPEYCLGCAGYLGMAVACLWDKDWEKYNDVSYDFFLGARGFDDMDDHITDTILQGRKHCVPAMQSVAGEAWHFLLKESPEPGTADAYRMFLITLEVMYKVGAAIELQHLGYKLT